MTQHHMLDDEICPIGDELLGELYSASKHGLPSLAATVPPHVRVMLALYCYRRSHLHAMGLAIAASCDEDDLVREGGRVGAMLFARSRETQQPHPISPQPASRRKITLASGPLRNMAVSDDEPDDEEIG